VVVWAAAKVENKERKKPIKTKRAEFIRRTPRDLVWGSEQSTWPATLLAIQKLRPENLVAQVFKLMSQCEIHEKFLRIRTYRAINIRPSVPFDRLRVLQARSGRQRLGVSF
jgi:hypothetical protein